MDPFDLGNKLFFSTSVLITKYRETGMEKTGAQPSHWNSQLQFVICSVLIGYATEKNGHLCERYCCSCAIRGGGV